jgi:hypothetical protein
VDGFGTVIGDSFGIFVEGWLLVFDPELILSSGV